MDDEAVSSFVNFVPCVKWVKQGVAKGNPEKIQLTKEELQDIVNRTKSELSIVKKEEADDDEEEEEEEENVTAKESESGADEYNFDKYDEETFDENILGIENIAVFTNTDGESYVNFPDDGEDSEKEDDVIRPKDNLILVGHVEGDASILEVYVYNEEEESLYVHHDFLLPAFPLCLEWLSYDPSEGKSGNLCLVGSMSPIIEAWDIDIVNCLEPAFKLGCKGNKKKGITKYGHRDAVLDLCWNKNLKHILASGSADQTVLLWDLDTGKYASKLTVFEEKVQTLEWHPFEGETLLVGSCDSVARIFDCRIEDCHKDWKVNGEVEKVTWNHFNPYEFLVGTNSGIVYNFDCRHEKPVWELSAHSGEITGLAFSSQCPGLLCTAGADHDFKVWDVLDGSPTCIYGQNHRLGRVLCMDVCPDLPFVVSIGGDDKKNNFKVMDVRNYTAVEERFGKRNLVCAVKKEEEDEAAAEESSAMETADAMFESLSLKIKAEPGTSKPVKKSFPTGGLKKKKKKKLGKK